MKKVKSETEKNTCHIPLHYHRTDGGAEYLTNNFIMCPNGHKEGVFEGATIIIRLDGDPEIVIMCKKVTKLPGKEFN